MKTYIFKTNLLENKNIFREIEIAETASLYKLAEAIVGAYDFYFDHCFGFFSKITENDYFNSERKYELFTDVEDKDVEPTGAESVKKTKVLNVWQKPGDKMMFLFDYGDNWQFVIELKDFGVKDAKKKYPKVLDRKGKSPEQYPECE